ncbi:polysaccharide deacetylase [Natronococcus pandeyae]|uniref:Polysaccharide deacetylase n=1 Tax=Natronococcus pandeyae TaxID=2055836 RepID=A0A8J8Q2A1_9EURY|nr:polysaccharide deacetylase family protein [Natronococcus pandeyae]TYL38101.1 polysaccharide deacetylase [Natronococcus pandeyae]
MKRRAYLAAASAVCLAGCAGSDTLESETTSNRNGSSDDDETKPDSTEPREPLIPEAADDFEELSRWSIDGGSMDADADRVLVGSQSARVEIPAAAEATQLSLEYESPFDLADVVPGVAMASSDFVFPWLRLFDADGNRIDYRRGSRGELPLMRYNFGVDGRDDAFDPTTVSKVQLHIWTDEGREPTVWFDDLHFVPRPETGKVMIQFDDNHVTDYTEALPVLEEYGYPAVTFVNPGRIEAETSGVTDPGGLPRITVDQTHELHDAGWVISNHCYNHPELADLEPDEQEEEIRRGKEWLENEGFDEGARYFAYPHGSYDATTLELIDEYHDLGFGGGHPVQGYNVNHVLNSRIGDPSAERMATELERTAEMRGITSFFYHRLEDDLLEDFETAIELLHEYESAGEIDVILPQDLERDYLF